MAQRQGDVQRHVFELMSRPASYSPPPDSVERIETHAAVVFLAGKYAYKVKRAVRLTYLDFSTLERRRAVCERELELNRRTAPGLYLGLVAITRQEDGVLSLGGRGEPVEWAIKMHRFEQDRLLDTMAVRHTLPLELMPALARTIGDAHSAARAVRRFDAARAMHGVVGQVAEAVTDSAADLNQKEADAYAAALEEEFRRLAPLMRQRGAHGYVRHCHGDLHLRNIVLLDGKPTLFDAIEFDDRIATIDILYDLAFLLMDLWHRGLRGHASRLFNIYMNLPAAGPPLVGLRGVALLPFFMSLRAGVRAMVARDRLRVASGEGARAAAAELKEFFLLARDLLRPEPPALVAIGGLSGTGKSTLAAELAPDIGPAPGALVVRSDVERKRLAGVSETKRLSPAQYSARATGRVYGALCRKAGAALSAGHTVIVDAVYAKPVQRKRLEATALRSGARFSGLWLEAPKKELVSRVEARRGDASDADASVVRKQFDYELGEITWSRIDASGSPDAVLQRALDALAQDRHQ